MRDTKPQRATASETAYRDATGTPTQTAAILFELAGAALSLLAAKGRRDADGARTAYSATAPNGTRFDICVTGPDVPAAIPAETTHPSTIPKLRPWIGKYRLAVRAPLLVLDLYWNADEPLRIMQFSRGDWERELRALSR